MSQEKKLLIIDSNAIIHRAFHALPPLQTKKGEIVNAVYGFCLMFLKAINEIRPDYVVACFDMKGPTFRHEQFKDYKAKRIKAPDELYSQIDIVKRVLTAFSVPFFEKQGYEADDLIATINFLMQKKQISPKPEIVILSGDMDNLQLVSANTKVYTMRKGLKDTVLYGIEQVKEKYNGLIPEQVVDYKALRGDPSDNIPGITGIGEKTAIQILKDFGSLDNLYKEIEKNSEKSKTFLKPNLLQKIKDYKDQAFISQKLALMDNKAPIDFSLKEIEFKGFDKEKAQKVLEDLEFFTLIDKFLRMGSQKKTLATKEKKVKNNQNELFSGSSAKNEDDLEQEIKNLGKDGVLSKELVKLELDLLPVVNQMQKNGIKVDFKGLNKLSLDFEKEIESLQKEIFKLSQKEFNLNSPSQLSEILFSDMGISALGVKKTPGGAISTNAEELKKLAAENPIISLIIEYREIFKLKTGFVDSLPKMINPKDGRIHPHFHQLGTETGRMSCSDPNLQNIPTKTKLGKKIRECFVPEEGFVFLSGDYSQMDFRSVASLSGDEKMTGFLQQGKDIHLMTASLIFKVKETEVSEKQRYLAKTLNYGVLYGLGPYGFAGRTGVSFQEAKEFIAQYFKTFKGIEKFVAETISQTKTKGFSETMFGRKRFLPEIVSRDQRIRAQAERIARNFPVQGTSADIMKMAMAKLAEESIFNKESKLVLQLHDELVLEVKKEKAKEVEKKLKEIMEKAAVLKVPLKVETKIGKNWGEV
ncbi:MAG: DNA polymerase [Candidatus Pacebacteria bacterium]|nr:DNA polymerase [Candidatus Paceibacterota bacterium]